MWPAAFNQHGTAESAMADEKWMICEVLLPREKDSNGFWCVCPDEQREEMYNYVRLCIYVGILFIAASCLYLFIDQYIPLNNSLFRTLCIFTY